MQQDPNITTTSKKPQKETKTKPVALVKEHDGSYQSKIDDTT